MDDEPQEPSESLSSTYLSWLLVIIDQIMDKNLSIMDDIMPCG